MKKINIQKNTLKIVFAGIIIFGITVLMLYVKLKKDIADDSILENQIQIKIESAEDKKVREQLEDLDRIRKNIETDEQNNTINKKTEEEQIQELDELRKQSEAAPLGEAEIQKQLDELDALRANNANKNQVK